MAEPINSLIALISTQNPTLRMIVTVVILGIGHLTVKLLSTILRRAWISTKKEGTKKTVARREETIKYVSYLLDATVIGSALFYLNTSLAKKFFLEITNFIPRLLSVFLIGILGVVTINLFNKATKDFLKTIGVKRYFKEAGLSNQAFNMISILIKGFLYLILIQIMLDQLGIGKTLINGLMNASSWAIAFLLAALAFYGLKDLVKNMAAGIYLKKSRMVRPGEEVRFEDETGEIRDLSLFSTALDTSTGYTLLAPNNEIIKSTIKLKRTKTDLETLEDITSYFVAQHPAYCGPASMEMALEIFGYRHDQDEIGEKADTSTETGTEIQPLIDATEELTNNEVKAAFIEYDKITDLGEEFKAWFNDGGLVIPNFYKPKIFEDATSGHFVLGVGVEGDEVLVMDPSGTRGGVYYVEKDRLLDAMGEFDHKRGYIAVAPKGTTAYWRIKNDLVYADKSYYDELSKTLESRLRKILRRGRILKEATPPALEDYREKWGGGEKITRIWNPKEEEDDNESSEDN
ncbi:MAG: C39 family peptidase [Candidatus Nanohaloarchaea archaeon]